MSTIRVDNFGPSSGGTSYSARGIAKAWVNFNGNGTIAARDSENVSSLTDNGTGDYTINFSNAFGAADYVAFGSNANQTGGTTGYRGLDVKDGDNFLTSSCDFNGKFVSDATTAYSDYPWCSAAFHGDLA